MRYRWYLVLLGGVAIGYITYNNVCTSGFVTDIMYSHSGLYMTRYVYLQAGKDSVTAETTALIPTEFCLTIKTS